MDQLILQLDLVPKTSWFDNLRKAVSQAVWKQLSKQTCLSYKDVCGICRTKNVSLECHEVWDYDDEKCIQKLVGLIALCKQCHQIKHYGLSQKLAFQGHLDLNKLHEHFTKVNKCSEETLRKHIAKARIQWIERSTKKWAVDLGEYKQYIQNV